MTLSFVPLVRRLAACALALVVLGAPAAPALSQQKLTTVRLGAIPNDDVSSVFYAIHAGLFRKAGLDVQLTPASNGPAVAAAVAGGAYDIGKSSIWPIVQAHDKGLPFVIVAPAAMYDQHDPYAALVTPPEVTIRSGKDLEGKVVGLGGLNDIGRLGINAWVDQRGGDARSIRFVEIPMSAAPAAIAQHRATAAEMSNPGMFAAASAGKVKVVPVFDAIAPSFAFSVWFTTTDFAKKHPDVVQSFARVVAEAAAYTNAHHADTVQLVADATKIPAETVEKMPRVLEGTTLNAGEVQPVIDAAAKYHLIAKPFPASELLYTGS
jgi:NitT/TauT family transport system substrate-binding protein